MKLGVGDLLNERIVLEEPLGRGGMGEVWRATHRGLGAPVAVKLLHATSLTDEASVVRLTREAQLVAQLTTPHVVRIYDVGRTGFGQPFVVMELLKGQDLKQRLETEGAFSLGDAANIVAQTSAALTAAHARGVVHRDIKPANMFLCEGGVGLFVKVLDFGLAKQLDAASAALTRPDALMGTPYYMSPEQFLSARSVDHRTDLWSLGVVTYAMLTGRLPFLADSVGALSVAVHDGDFAPVRSLVPELPAALDGWFARALAPERARRFSSALEMSEALAATVAVASRPFVVPVVAAQSTPPEDAEPSTPRPTSPSSVFATGVASAPPLRKEPVARAQVLPPTTPQGPRPVLAPVATVVLPADDRDAPQRSRAARPPPAREVHPLVPLAIGLGIAGALVGGAVFYTRRQAPPENRADEEWKRLDITETPVKEMYGLAEGLASSRSESLTLTALSFSGVDAEGRLRRDGRFKVYFSTSTWRCVQVAMAHETIEITEDKCAHSQPISWPRCTLPQVRARMAGYPDAPANAIYTRTGDASPQWLVNAGGQGGFVDDDC